MIGIIILYSVKVFLSVYLLKIEQITKQMTRLLTVYNYALLSLYSMHAIFTSVEDWVLNEPAACHDKLLRKCYAV